MAACTCCSILSVRWRVTAAEPPAAVRRCPRCDRRQPFRSSGRFRVNASGRRVDVWLVYRCPVCEASWNRPVHERVPVDRLGPRLERYHRNDAEAALAVALRPPAGVPLDWDVPVEIEGCTDAPLRATLVVEHPVAVRLDRLLASHLRIPRSAVAALVDDPRLLRRPPRDGAVVSLDGCRRRG